MPEGPEIRIEADKIAKAIVGAPLEEVYFEQAKLKQFGKRLVGTCVTAVDTKGKAMLTRFTNSLSLYSHNQLYGRWYIRDRGKLPSTGRTLRVALHTGTSSALLYSASEIAVLTTDEILSHSYLSRLGPDVLDEQLSWKDFYSMMRESKYSRRSLGALYLDQAFIAGIGNYLRSEILFRAGLKPERSLASLSAGEATKLARATVTLSRRAYETKGITNPSGRVAALKKQGKTRGAYRFAVFARHGKPCYECGEQINRIEVSGRRLYLCQSCQS